MEAVPGLWTSAKSKGEPGRGFGIVPWPVNLTVPSSPLTSDCPRDSQSTVFSVPSECQSGTPLQTGRLRPGREATCPDLCLLKPGFGVLIQFDFPSTPDFAFCAPGTLMTCCHLNALCPSLPLDLCMSCARPTLVPACVWHLPPALRVWAWPPSSWGSEAVTGLPRPGQEVAT